MTTRRVFLMEPLPGPPHAVVYLAGPVPSGAADPSWHEDAVQLFASRGFDGSVVVPRPREGTWPADMDRHIAWQADAQARSDALMFWVPRDLDRLPGFTTNLEWGIWHASRKAVLGAPPHAPGMAYLRHWATHAGAPQAQTLESTVDLTLRMISCKAPGNGEP